MELLTVKPGGNHWTLKGHKAPVIFSYILSNSSFTNRRSSSHNLDSYKATQPYYYISTISVQKVVSLCLRNLDTRRKRMLRFTPRLLVPSPPQNPFFFLSNCRLRGLHSPCGRSGERKNLLPLQGIEFSIPYRSHCTD